MTGGNVQPETDETKPAGPLRLCETCGNMTTAELSYCMHCGALSREAVEAMQQDRAEHRFFTDLAVRATPVTTAILVINILIYLIMAAVTGGSILQSLLYMNDIGVLVAFGAKTNELLRQGEWFRLITPIFLHGGLLHLASNSYAIYAIGPLVEKLYGSARYLLLYLLAGVGGVIGSFIGSRGGSQTVPGVGASGAIFGLFGALLVVGYKYRNELPPRFRQSIKSGILPVIVINLFIGFSIPFIDNAAHIGGLVTGALLAFAIPYIAPGQARVTTAGKAIIGGCILLVGASFVQAWQASPQHLARRSDSLQTFLDAVNQAESATVRFVREVGRPNDAAPASSDLREDLDKAARLLVDAPVPDSKAESIRKEFLELVKLQQAALESPSPASRLESIASGLIKIREDFKKWIASDGERYGLRLKQSEVE